MGNGESDNRLVHSHFLLRRLLGLLGISLPVALVLTGSIVLGEWDVRGAISDYYGFDQGRPNTRDVFVGYLVAMAVFLIVYKGHEDDPVFRWGRVRISDNILGMLAGAGALITAIFPNSGENWEGVLHFIGAGTALTTFGLFAYFAFTKSGKEHLPADKVNRNRIYRACGIAIFLSVLLIVIRAIFLRDTPDLDRLDPVFWLECVALWGFGVSWIVKGHTLRILEGQKTWPLIGWILRKLEAEAS